MRTRFAAGARMALLAAPLIFLCGCHTMWHAPVVPPQGWLFTQVKAPLTTNFKGTPVGAAAPKEASDSSLYIYDFIFTGLSFGWDDVAIQRIAKQGGIKEVAYADYEGFLVCGVFGRFTITVHGN